MNAATSDIKTIFGHALELESPAERRAYVEVACESRESLRDEVLQLLAAHDGAGDFLRGPVVIESVANEPPAGDRLGTSIGPYVLEKVIGEGGMGVVYLAEQQQPVKRKVALKVIKPGMDTRQVIARFEMERQVLALMDHPCIARILDGGATPAGRPYFVMDLVQGVPITRYADEQCLTMRQRLELFVSVCHAVQHAHHKGIIHRDLKPSNILVTSDDGRPAAKIIDFGIAKAVSPQFDAGGSFTSRGHLVGTPQYMSPEQAAGILDVDTRSDIYSLGAVLYELLTGDTPLAAKELNAVNVEQWQRMIREDCPLAPSQRLDTLDETGATIAERRASEPKKLVRALRGELDWIAMKALEKDRARRYESVADLARDVDRYLRGEPVLARPPSLSYLMRKAFSRHRAPIVAGCAVLVALVGGVIGTSLGLLRALDAESTAKEERDRAITAEARAESERSAAIAAHNAETAVRKDAEAAHRRTRAALDTLTEDMAGRWLGRRTEIGQRERRFLGQIEQHYQALADARGDTEISRSEQANGNLRVAEIRRQFGDLAGAERCVRQAITLYKNLVAEFPEQTEHRRGLAGAYHDLARATHEQGQLDSAIVRYRSALEAWREVNAASDNRYRWDITFVQANLANVLQRREHLAEAERMHREVIAERTAMLAESPSAARQFHLAGSFTDLGGVLRDWLRLSESADAFGRSLDVWQSLLEQSPGDEEYLEGRAMALRGLSASLFLSGRYSEVEQVLNNLIDYRRRLAADFPAMPRFQIALADVLRGRANALRALGKYQESERDYRESIALHAPFARDPRESPEHVNYWLNAQAGLARTLLAQRRLDEAKKMLDEALVHHERVLASDPNHPAYQRVSHRLLRTLARALIDAGDYQAAAEVAAKVGSGRGARPIDISDAATKMLACAWLAAKDSRVSTEIRSRGALRYAMQTWQMLPSLAVAMHHAWSGGAAAAGVTESGDVDEFDRS